MRFSTIESDERRTNCQNFDSLSSNYLANSLLPIGLCEFGVCVVFTFAQMTKLVIGQCVDDVIVTGRWRRPVCGCFDIEHMRAT